MLPLLLWASAQATAPEPPAPAAIVAAARPAEWVTMAPDALLVMELAPGADGRPRRVVIQLIADPLSRSWIDNVLILARTHWYDGTAITRVQDDYVAQWGDPNAGKAGAKPLPTELNTTGRDGYTVAPPFALPPAPDPDSANDKASYDSMLSIIMSVNAGWALAYRKVGLAAYNPQDSYADATGFWHGWPVAMSGADMWPVHCYGAVGVGRDVAPDTGSGAELYAVIGHAPRHLDRNLAVVGRVVEGIEHLSSLPRGTEPLGVYATAGERTAIRSVRLASDLPERERPRLQYLSTDSDSFAAYADARANRRDTFFVRPAGGVDVCNVPVPVRRAP